MEPDNCWVDAGESDGAPASDIPGAKRKASRYYVTPTVPHHDFIFKPFNRESWSQAKKRRAARSKSIISIPSEDPERPSLEPDPFLASGQQLPPAFLRKLPPELVGKPIVDIDPYYADSETFVIISRGKELTRFSASKALYVLGPFHPIRRIVLYILVNPIFNLLVILTILTNCLLMTFQGNEAVESTEIIFTIIYTIEMGLKVLARGFIVDKFTYLRDPWNWLDFLVIIMAYLTIVVQDLGNLSVIRTFRVLRALKTVAIIPGMKTIVGAVIDSVKNLKDVVVLTLFSLSVFSLLGLQIYMGQLTQKCILNGPSNMSDIEWFKWANNQSNWVIDTETERAGSYRLCGNATGAQACPMDHTCMTGFGPNPDYGFTNFDTFGWALICSFRLMTQDYWEGIYMQVLKTAGSWHISFFIVSIFLGSIYLMNLILAIVAMSYNELQRRAEAEEEAAAEDEANFLNQCKQMEEFIDELGGGSSCNAPSSYRPSIEIGLLGQTMLANLCQSGLLGEQLREKLNQQLLSMPAQPESRVGGGSFSGPTMGHCWRSRSFSAKRAIGSFSLAPTNWNQAPPPEEAQRRVLTKRKAPGANSPPAVTASMTELRRRSSVRGPKPLPGLLLTPRNQLDKQPAQSPPQSPAHLSTWWLRQSTGNTNQRSGVTSERDLASLRQRAALIRIVSDDCSSTNKTHQNDIVPHLASPKSAAQLSQSAQVETELGLKFEPRRAQLDPEGASIGSGSLSFHENQRARTGSRDSLLNRQLNNKKTDIADNVTNLNYNSEGDSVRQMELGMGRHLSEAAICLQPVSIHGLQAGYEPPSQALRSGEKIAPTSSPGSLLLDRNSNRQQLAIDHSNPMHHLSVENFQQFGLTRSKAIDSSEPSLATSNSAKEQPIVVTERTAGRKSRLSDGRGLIKPSTILHFSAFNRGRPSIQHAYGRPGSPVTGSHLSSARRASQDLVRRASNWSRQSMTGNVDLRRLLRLWAHTNPYHGRTSVDSMSNTSQQQVPTWHSSGQVSPMARPSSSNMMAGDRAQLAANSNQALNHNPPAQFGTEHMFNYSTRPSSVGSTRQAYELISAFSRRHDLYPSDARYSLPLDENLMADQVSINLRDKCLAYCFSCLDFICIWECCGIWLKVQQIISIFVFDPFTELFIILCILINTLFMALDSDDADDQMKSIFERANYFFTATFAVEASLKIMALSPKFYFREGWNVFDSIIVALSLLELGLEGVYGLSVLRSFRLLRVFKLAKSWPTLNLLISIMGKAVGDLGNLTFVLAIIVFIFAVMGMQLFGNKYVAHNFPNGELPRWNFTDFMHSFMIVFRILCAEWIEPMWDCLLVGGWPCIPFFLIAVTVGNLVVLNLFLALLLASFGASNLSSPQAENVDTKKLREAMDRFQRFGSWCKRYFRRLMACLFAALRSCLHLPNRKQPDDLDGQSDLMHREELINGSHIVILSKKERMKNIELHTEELKKRIRRSQDDHFHLTHLAQMQFKENSHVGCNFRYGTKSNADQNASGNAELTSLNNKPMPNIPIIVDEVTDLEQGRNNANPDDMTEAHSELSLSMNLSSCSSAGESGLLGSPGEQRSSNSSTQSHNTRVAVGLSPDISMPVSDMASNFKQTSHRHSIVHAANMQPIREDSRDSESSISVTDHHLNKEQTSQPASAEEGRLWYRAQQAMRLGLYQEENISADDTTVTERKPCERLALQRIVSAAIAEEARASSRFAENQEVQVEQRPKSSLYLKPPERADMEEDDERALENIDSYMEKCICFGSLCLRWFIFRKSVRKIVEHKYFDQCILVLIVISSGTLALEDKHLNERPNLKRILDVLDTIFTVLFSLEMIFKWLAFGFRRYLSNIWSWLDFFIVLVSLINLVASILGSGKIQALKTMRTLRAMRGLRPLRALQRFQGMRVVVNALIQAIPSIFNVLLVCLIFWLIFSIMGVQMFGGKFWRCINPETKKVVSYEQAANKIECLERNLTWSNPQINFDNVLNAYLALFQVATFQGWIDIMNRASDSRTRDEQPFREANIYTYFYFVFFVIFGSFFTLNLFIGVIIDNFNEQKKKTGGSLEIFMTDDQKKYYHAMKKMRSKRPVKAMTRPKMRLQAYMFDIITSKKFDVAIMIIIGLNMFVMALEHYGQSQEFSIILENLNLIFIAIFTLECLGKIFAMRHFYFREPWNIFDFVVVNLSLLGVVMKEYVSKYFVSPTLLRVVRVVKVGRVLRLVKGAKGIRTLLFALAMSLPALFNICLLLFLVMFIYAIFGMSFFMNVRPRAGIDETFNFGTFWSSIIVLFEMSTSAGWDTVLDPLMDEENDCQKPDPANGIEGTCGNKSIAIFYLISYVIVTFLIIINMYIAVILENYSQAAEDVQEGLTDDDYEMYYEIWQKFDPDGTQYLPYTKLSDFIDALEDPLRVPKPNELAIVVMDINIYQGNRCYCVDILDALTKFFFTRKGLVIQVNEHLEKVQSTLHETPFERITTTYLVKRENYCARIIQNCWRKWKLRTQSGRLALLERGNDCSYSRATSVVHRDSMIAEVSHC